jgi:hypothetical protein
MVVVRRSVVRCRFSDSGDPGPEQGLNAHEHLRPVAYQGLPDAALPAPLRQNNPWRIPRRLDGEIE